jgi:hypothetical protein
MHYKALLLLLTAVLAQSGCEDGYIFPNEAPSQLSISKDVCYVAKGQEVPLSGVAYDGDGDPIYYQWSTTGGTFDPPDGKGSAVVWTAPQTPGMITITLSVTDEIEVSHTSETIEVGGSFPSYITNTITIADSGFVYILDKLQPVVVPDNVTLTIDGGVRIVVNSENGGIVVEGILIALGTQGNEVIIGPSSCLPEKGEWNGIRFIGTAASGELTFMRIHSAENGIIASGGASVNIRNCTLNNHSNNGVEVSDSARLTMTQCTVWENSTGVYVRNSELDMQRSSIRYNGEIGLELSATSEEFTARIDTCNISNNKTYGIYITGIAQPEIHYCSIFSNGSTGTGEAVRLEAYAESDSVRVDYNFWGIGYDSEEEIASLVHDRNDVAYGILAYIDFTPWLTSVPGGGP